MAQDRKIPFIVVSGREPVTGVAPWLGVADINALREWLREVAVPMLGG
jgi:hypothetical protein